MLVLVGAVLTLAEPALAGGGSSIADAPVIRPGVEEFGNLATDQTSEVDGPCDDGDEPRSKAPLFEQ